MEPFSSKLARSCGDSEPLGFSEGDTGNVAGDIGCFIGFFKAPRRFNSATLKSKASLKGNESSKHHLGGGFKDFLFSPLFGEDFQFD